MLKFQKKRCIMQDLFNTNYYGYQQAQRPNQYFYVNGIEGARAYSIQPNQTVMLMDSDDSMFYIKQANGQGQASIKAFKFEEVDLSPKPIEPIDTSNFVTKSQFEEFQKSIKGLLMAGGQINE